MANETQSVRGVEQEFASSYILGLEAEPEPNEVYRRYLKNYNFTSSRNLSLILQDFAKMVFTENSSNTRSINKNRTDDDYAKPLNNPFDVANSEFILILLTVIYVIIFITGVLGNVVTCIVIAKNKGMHTAVNYYLFSLAVSDLLLLISALPDEVYMLWFREYPFNETVCKFHKFAAESLTNATVFTITAFTIERYVAICKPFLSHTMSKLSRAYKFILVIWMISICLAVPQTLFTLHLDETYHICVPKQDYNHLFVVSTFLLFVIPMSIITILYVLIGLQLRKSKIVQRGAVNGSSVRLKRKIFKKATNQTLVTVNCESHYNDALLQHSTDANKNHFIDHDMNMPEDGRINYSNRGPSHSYGSRHVVNMLVVVVIAFFLCWAPFHVQRIVFTYIEHRAISENLSFSINYISGVLFFVSTCINPFLYNIMSNKFREAFKVTIGSYLTRSNEKDFLPSGKLFRTVSQRSYSCSVNSTSMNTCSSVCSMQPFNHSQQLPFRYFDSDMAKKRPLVVSFRRIQKMAPNNLESCGSVSICDIHRLDTKIKDNNELMTMKIVSKYGANFSRSSVGKKNSCYESQSYRSMSSMDRQRPQLDSLFDENIYHPSGGERVCVFPKEKFYGNAKLLMTVNDDILQKAINDQDEDPYERYIDMKRNSNRNVYSVHQLTRSNAIYKGRPKLRAHQLQTITPKTADNKMIDDAVKNCRATQVKNHFLWREEDIEQRFGRRLITENESPQSEKLLEYGTMTKAQHRIPKSSSADVPLKKLSTYEEHLETDGRIHKSVSMLSFIDVK